MIAGMIAGPDHGRGIGVKCRSTGGEMDLAAEMNRTLRAVPPGAVYVAGLIPLAVIVWGAATGGLGVDPVKEIEHRLGMLGLQFLIAGLAVSPLRRFTGLSLMRQRRALGLLAFVYVTLHLLAWIVLDMALLWEQALRDIVRRPYLSMGMVAFVLMVPLAITSNDRLLRRMGGQAWRRLHWLTYPAALAALIHYIWQLRAGIHGEAVFYVTALLLLLALRLVPRRR